MSPGPAPAPPAGGVAVGYRPSSDAPTTDPDRSRASGPAPDTHSTRARPALIVGILLALLAVPLVVTLVVLRDPRWQPIGDLAQTELRVRDVGSGDTPLIGLAGRFGTLGEQGSHPGPLSFYALAPVYRLLGATAFGMRVATVVLNLTALGAVLGMAHRRGGPRVALGFGAALAVLTGFYGGTMLTEAWNPFLPVMWWLVLLMAVWSVLSDDLPMLPVAVFAASFCMQTHAPYIGLGAGMGALAVGAAGVMAWRRRAAPGRWRRLALWGGIAVAIGVVVWIPPVVDQLTNSPGNLSLLRDEFTDPPEDPIGFRQGGELLLGHLNPWRIVSRHEPTEGEITGSPVPGVLMLVAWAAAAFGAWRLRHRALLRLHIVLAVALPLALVSMSRIHGIVWYYLGLWAWGMTALMIAATVWTVAVAVPRAQGRPRWLATGVPAVLAGLAVLATGLFVADAARLDVSAPQVTGTLRAVSGPTIDALDDGSVVGGGRDGRYLLSWNDPISIGSQGVGLLNELERAGFDVGAEPPHRGGVAAHRVIRPRQASAVVHLSVGPDIDVWRAKAGAVEVAYVDPRDREERAEYARLRRRVIVELQAAGRSELVANVDGNVFTASLNTDVPLRVRRLLVRLLDLGLPTAVFVAPVSAL